MLFVIGFNLSGQFPFINFNNEVYAQASLECDGGYCEFIDYFGGEPRTKCTACCPAGKNPSCTSSGCTCNLY